MSFHGGLLGVMMAMSLRRAKHSIDYLRLMDFVAPLVPPGLAAGRLGNFINGELPGPRHRRALGHGVPRRRRRAAPSVAALPVRARRRSRCSPALVVLVQAAAARPGVGDCSCIGYGVFRFLTEFVREPDAFLGFLALGMTMGQWLCVPMIAGGIALFAWSRR